MHRSLPVACSLLLGLAALACEGDDGTDPIDGGNGQGGAGASDGAGGMGGGSAGTGGAGTGGGPPVVGEDCGEVTCPAGASCELSEGMEVCVCADGLEGTRCEDVDECAATPNPCGADSTCENTYGSFYCDCDSGFEWSGSACVDIDECADDPCHPDADCSDFDGGYSCTCTGGKVGDGFFCKDTDACSGDPCGENGNCVNTPGGYACQCDSGYSGDDSCTTSCSTLPITDGGLEAAVRAAIDEPLGTDPLTPADVAGIDELDASEFGIFQLDGLECWPHLRKLDLSDNAPLGEDPGTYPNAFDSLQQLNQLEEIDFSCTPVSSLDALADHPSLQVVRANAIGCNPSLTDIDALASMPQLVAVDLRGHDLTSVASLSNARGLQSVQLSNNSLSSVDALAGLPVLEALSVDGNALTSIAAFESHPALERFILTDNDLSSLAATASLARLRELRAGSNPVSSVPDWTGLAQLRKVNLSGAELTSVAPLSGLAQVKELDLTANDISDLSPFVDADFQGTLIIFANPLPCESQQEVLQTLSGQGIEILGSCQP